MQTYCGSTQYNIHFQLYEFSTWKDVSLFQVNIKLQSYACFRLIC